MELDEGAQRELKREMLAARFGLVVEQVEGWEPALGYRYASKRVALSLKGQLVLGSYARESHRPAAMTGCLVDHARLVAAFDEIEARARELGVIAYDEGSGSGDLRAVWAKTNGAQTIVTLVVRTSESLAASALPEQLRCADGVLVSVHSGASNNLRGEKAVLSKGRAELSLTLLGQELALGALGFLQPNPEVAARAYQALTAWIAEAEGSQRAFDLYAGAGVTTRLLARHFREVLPCEAHPESAAALGIAPESAEDFLARQLAQGARAELVIANPPRKGLGPEVVSHLHALKIPELRIMSCGPEGLARDLAALTAQGGYQLVSLRAFDTLPQTPHVELVAQLRLASH